MLRRMVEKIVPARLGISFRWLLGASVIGNLGDGIVLAAGPLLVASQTADPFLVALAALLQRLPWLIFGVFAGAVVDRLDRRRLMILTNLIRAAVLAALGLSVIAQSVNIVIVLIAMFLLGTAETFADTTASTLAPSLVPRADLGISNARIQGSMIITNQLAGPPIGALIFAASMALPFLINAVCFALAALLVRQIVLTSPGELRERSTTVRADIVEGLRWLLANPPVRTLALTIVLFNVTYGAAFSVLVLYADQQLGMDELGYGALITASAVGGIAATACYGALERRISLANLMRIGLIIESLTHLGLALTRSAWVAFVIMVIFGAHAFVWGTTSTTIRQRSVPSELLGRVTSVYLIGVVGGLVIGAALGGLIARQWGISGPFWFGFVGSALLTVAVWRQLTHIARPD